MIYNYNSFVNEKLNNITDLFKNNDIDFYNKLINNKNIKTIDELTTSYIDDMVKNHGSLDDVEFWIDTYFNKDYNTKKDIYYHVNTKNDESYSGVGNGLYLGRDYEALSNFYDIEQEGFSITSYIGNPSWLDLTNHNDFRQFKEIFKNISGEEILNSDKLGKLVISLGFDGIRYFDYMATGEEFVLFNQSKLHKIDEFYINESINENINYDNFFVKYDTDKYVYHITGKKIANIINKEGFRTGYELNVAEKRKAIFFADKDVNYGIYARNKEGDEYEGDDIGEVRVNLKGLNLLNMTYQDKNGIFTNHKKYSTLVTRGELDKIPYNIDGTISYLEDGGIYEVALKKEVANKLLIS